MGELATRGARTPISPAVDRECTRELIILADEIAASESVLEPLSGARISILMEAHLPIRAELVRKSHPRLA